MGLFGRKTKKKNRVSFGDDIVEGDFHNATEDEKLEKAPAMANNNSLTSSSSSSRKPHTERGEGVGQEKSREVTSTNDAMLPFREPKAMSVCSDIEESNHQNPHKQIVGHNYDRNRFNDEAEYMYESDNIDEEIEFMDDMTSDPNESKTNSSTRKYMMPSIPDLDEEEISKSGRIDDREVALNGTKTPVRVIERNDSNSNSNSTQKVQGKNRPLAPAQISGKEKNHDTSRLYQGSTSSGSNTSAREQRIQEGQRPQQQQSQIQYNPQQEQQLYVEHETQREKTRDLVKVFIGEIWNRGEIESIQRVCSPRLRFNGHTGLERVGHDGFSRMVTTVRSSLEGYHCEIHSMVVEGRKCFCRLKFTGKHVGELMGYPPTHKLVAWMGASEFTICPRRNQILKVWELGDIKTLEAQLMG